MNERIKELAEQAGFENGHQDRNGNSLSYELEKFAELIVKECANFIDSWEKYQIDMCHQTYGVMPPTGGSDELKKHFGVAE